MGKVTPEEFGRLLSVGEVAKRSGIAASAVRFYENQGIIRSVRTEGNQRRYKREVLRRVAVVKVAQRLGIPLAEIRHALDQLPHDSTPTAEDWGAMSAAWRAELDRRIQRLTQLRDHLNDCIGCGCLSLRACPLRNPWDELSEKGPGARLLET